MPNEKLKQKLSVDDLRHAEYYDMQNTFDELYAKSKKGESFSNLMDIILSKENILLAYRNIKSNSGSNTPGTDKLTIKDIGKLTPEEVIEKVRFILKGSQHGYRPKPVRRKEIPKPNGTTRPLGIPCIWDRIIQQCIKQVMEPICEARFSESSYGFRPNRSVENAISRTYNLMQLTKLHYVIEVDIKSFFDNVNHSKLIKQIWAIGIRDKHLIYIIKQIIKAPIKMQNGQVYIPEKGTPQGGIISPLLSNIALNELDHWIESQWQENPVAKKYALTREEGRQDHSHGYRAMKNTDLKEMYIVRYADDFRIFCRNRKDAEKTKIAVVQWLKERLKLEVSQEKTRIVNVKQKYSEFLGFKIKVHKKGEKYVVKSHIADKQLKTQEEKILKQAKNIAKPRKGKTEFDEVRLYNSMVLGAHNYYQIATDINLDYQKLRKLVMTIFTNRLKSQNGNRLHTKGRKLTTEEAKRYAKSDMLRYVAGTDEPIYPIGYIQHKNPMSKKKSVCSYTVEGRKGLHENLQVNTSLMLQLMRQQSYGRSIEYMDNRVSLYSAQQGKCAITGILFESVEDVHCHHKIPRSKGGSDKYENLALVLTPIHKLIHATEQETIQKYMSLLNLNKEQLSKFNEIREIAGLEKL